MGFHSLMDSILGKIGMVENRKVEIGSAGQHSLEKGCLKTSQAKHDAQCDGDWEIGIR
jgi:hypothetical protein